MAVLTDYKGLDVVEGSTGSGGVALTENFKELADRAPYQTATNPGTGDDSTKEFSPGDYWLNTSTLVLWASVSNTASAAVWKSILLRSGTGLELIPSETSEEVHVAGKLRVDGETQLAGGTFADRLRGLPTTSDVDTQSIARMLTVNRVNTTVDAVSIGVHTDQSGVIACNNSDLLIGKYNGTNFYLWLRVDYTVGASSAATWFFSQGAYLDIEHNKFRLRTPKTPTSSTDTGNKGDVCWDTNTFTYVSTRTVGNGRRCQHGDPC